MTDWYRMFEAVQTIVQSSPDWQAGIAAVITFAEQDPAVYSPDYWRSVISDQLPLATVISWVVEGFERLEPYEGWSLVMLDCGDSPDIFRMTEARLSDEMSLDQFLGFAKLDALRDAYEFPGAAFHCILNDHNVRELDHALLTWNRSGNDFHGDDGYLLWLSVAALALREVCRNLDFCQRILRGRSTLVLMSGFEEIFFYSGTISAAGYSRE